MGIFTTVQELGHEQVVFCHDRSSGLKAIIGIHDTTLGPALGGTRLWDYASDEEAITDVLRLSRGMTYKAAVAGLNLGGGKAVIIGNPSIKSEALFRGFGRFINSLDGRYITAEDVNINTDDMVHVRKETPYVCGLPGKGGAGDPSPFTALGVFEGIRASARHRLQKESLNGMTVAVQGCGAVGSYLCGYLNEVGVKLIVSDIDDSKTAMMKEKYGAEIMDLNKIHAADCDVYAPCALGATVNDESIPELKCTIIAGGANNQLQKDTIHGPILREKNILYAPDYVINAGGLISVYQELLGYDEEAVTRQTHNIYNTMLEVYRTADKENISTHIASDRVAEARINSIREAKRLDNNYERQGFVQR